MSALMKNAFSILRQWSDNGIFHAAGSGAPVDGTTGKGVCGRGSTYTDVASGNVYVNIGTETAPIWQGQGVLVAEVALSAAEINALRATPKTLVAAPGAGKLIEFLSAVLLLDATATAFVVGTNDLAIRYKDGAGDIISQTIDTAGFLDQTSDIMTWAGPLATDSKTPKADCENQPLVLHNTGAGELTTGTGVVRVKVTYRLWTTGW